MSFPLLLTVFVGIAIRIWIAETPFAQWLSEENEVVTPLNSWKRVTEGLSLHKSRIASPYAGDMFHETPLMLRMLNYFNGMWGDRIYLIFVAADLIIAILLERIAKHHGRYLLDQQKGRVSDIDPGAISLLHRTETLVITRFYVVAAYLYNPYVLMSCAAKSTAVFNNLAVAGALLATLTGRKLMACLCIAVASYLSLYPVMLIVPAALYFVQLDTRDCRPSEKSTLTSHSCMMTSAGVMIFGAILIYVSYLLEGSWRFMNNTYGFILTVPDLTPNSGVFWYFFTEMFEHFRVFFICVFQINAFIYTVPLAVRLKEHPIFMMYILVGLIAIFKPYPCYADVGLVLSLLPVWKYCFPYMRNNFLVSVMLGVCAVFAPILYYLWIYAGSANANFYFAITLVYTTAQIFLVTDLLFGFLRREYDLQHGTKPPVINGKPAMVILD